MTFKSTLLDPQQASAVWQHIYPKCKAYLMAGHRLELTIAKQKRSTEQNAKLWATLGDISRQVVWYGERLSPESWKDVLTAALKKQKTVPGIDGGFVVLGQSTSKMSVAEMSELLELALAFGAEREVVFTKGE